ncbi:gtp binding protein [Moniliophthora roreri MCA 2997]|uniref:Gtp binding protein n=2 Tax=Moniliophthora roreri TaxID=221103 RepID=V2X3E2_MONRO|nr:gtp binding protein [Moniliophthora roreri MCA 2997]KAI3609621.1 gtp binding protein [Moniliophthora roreri]
MKGSPLRDRLLSNSPDPIKSSILRDSGMGWNSPPSSEPTSPLRIAKRDPSPSKPTQADLARRSSSSYRAMRNNNLVTKSPFKSQIPTPSTPSRNPPVPVLFPTRRVSGEKRPRPLSMHEQAEEENERPFALKRDRKQSKTFQGLIEKEPVTKSPFRRLPFKAEDNPPRLPPKPPLPAQSSRIPTATTANTASPLRSSLVSKRMHGPRLSGGKRRERRKTVTFDERMDVMEFERDEYDEEAVEDSEDDYGPTYDDDDADDPFYQNHLHQEPSHDVDPEPEPGYPNPDDSYESIELSDSGVAEPELQLDADTSINGLVDDLFAGHNNLTSTPPRAGHNELPADLETEDGVPLGRTHHRDRALRFHQHQHSDSPARNSPISFNLNRPITLPNTSDDSAPSTPPKHVQSSSPPLGRSTHMERRMAARQEEQEVDKDVDMLPASPSPVKPRTPGQHQYLMQDDSDGDGLVPKFDLSTVGGTPNRSHTSEAVGPDPFALPNLKDEALPEGGNSFISMNGTDTSLDGDASQNSEVMNVSALEKQFGGSNERLLNTSLEASPMHNEHASFSQSSAAFPSRPFSPTEQASVPPPIRRSPLPPIPAGIAPHPGSPRGISPLRGRSSSPRLRPRISRDDVRLRIMGPAIGGRRFGSASPSPRSSPAPEPQVNGRDSPRVNEEVQKDETSQDDQVQPVVSAKPSDEIERKAQVTEEAEPGNRLSADLGHGITPDAASIMTGMTENSAEEATIETALVVGVAQHHHHPQQTDFADEEEKMDTAPLEPEEEEGHSSYEDAPEEDEGERQEEFGILKPPMIGTLGLSSSKLNFDFGSKFGLGGLGIDTSMDNSLSTRPPQPSYHRERDVPESIASRASGDSHHSKTSSTSSNMVRMGAAEEDVSMDMRSALDRLMEDVGGVGVAPMDTSVATDATDDDDEPLDLRAARVKNQATAQVRVMERAATDSAMVINSASGALSRSGGSDSSIALPPPPPPKDNIRAREQLILEKRREMRKMEEAEDVEYYSGGDIYVPARRGPAAGIGKGRPSRRRSMSTGDMHDLAQKGAKLDVAPMLEEDPLEESIEKELQKRDGPKKSKYLVREREAIYASSDVSHMAGPGDVNAGKAWRTVRRPSDMNEYSKQIKEYRANQNPGKAYGKVFVKVMGVKNLHVPIPQEPTIMSCTLNNGIHFVTTPECRLSKDTVISQEFELIEHSKLEFTLTLKVRRDPHIITQFKALQPPPPQPPPMVQQTSSKSSTKSGGMFSLFSSSPKKSKEKEKERAFVVAAPPPPPVHRLPENLARYMKPDGTFARAFISFKDIAHRCDTKIFETTFPLIGQRLEAGNKASTMQVGEIVLQMFRLPPLPGIPPDQLPQSLEECHRGLRHVNWHKVTYFEGTLTQSGGDCTSWRRRRLRVVGANLIAFNDVTKRVTATINLKSAIAVEDDQEARNGTLSPASGTTARSARHEYEGLYGVERSFRLIFPGDEEICFFADTDEDKARWLEVLRALVGHIPPHPLWAELLWQRQNDLNSRNAASTPAQ